MLQITNSLNISDSIETKNKSLNEGIVFTYKSDDYIKRLEENTSRQDNKRGIGLGVFDGCHRGHQELIRTLLSRTQELGMTSCIYTFCNHPALISGNHDKISMGLLSSEEDKIELLKNTGVDEILCQEFSKEFANVSALEFLEKYLYELLNTSLIVVGYNYQFGRGREGDVSFLKTWAKEKGIEVIVIDSVVFNGASISSSTIRKSIKKGDFETVTAMLGREYSLSGIVMPGQKLGTKLGFPTANVKPSKELCLPDNGVYVTRLKIDDHTYESITNIGIRPSISETTETPIIETMILDNDFDLYGKKIQIMFLHLLRKEKKFDQIEDLKSQVYKDIQKARTWHAESEHCWEMAKIRRIPIFGIRSTRFTGDVINIVIQMPLSKKTASINALLARVLTASCRQFPSRIAISKYLDSLYGASIDSHTEASGDIQLIHFTADALHTWRGLSFPFKDTVDLLFDMLLNPDFDKNGNFSKEIFESERYSLITELYTRENDKTKYALDKCIDFLTFDTVQNTRSTGEISILQEITLEEMTDAYNDLMEKAKFSIYVAGNIDSLVIDRICDLTEKTFYKNKSTFDLVPGKTPQCYKPAPFNEKHEEIKEIEQARVCIAYKGLMPYFSNSTGAITIFNSMLGGDVHSLLFDVVREQMGLAYSVFSVSLRYLSSVVLIAGVSPENTDITIKAMEAQVARLANNDFDDALFQSSIESVSYSYRAVSDDLHSMIFYYMNAMIGGRNVSLQDALCFMKDFSRETIVEIAKKLELSVIYTLTQSNDARMT